MRSSVLASTCGLAATSGSQMGQVTQSFEYVPAGQVVNETSAVATRINDANIIGSQNVRPMPLQERGLATKGQLAASRQRATTCALSPALFHGPTLLRRRARVAPTHAPYTVALDCCATGTKGGVV